MKFKSLFVIVFVNLLIFNSILAQSPQKMTYQAVVRNANNNLIVNHEIGIRVSILQGSENGIEVYKEIYSPNIETNDNGLISIQIGSGISQLGNFSQINWANGTYFLKTEIDPNGGVDYSIIGVSQLLTVPYAMHSKTAETITGIINETDPTFSAWDKDYSDLSNKPTLFSGSYNDLNNKPDLTIYPSNTELNTALSNKVDKVAGKVLSTNDYTNAEQTKLAGIATGAEVNVNADWNSTSGDSQIINKPNFASVATSGSYIDLNNKPDLFSGLFADLLNKPTSTIGYGITDAVLTTGSQIIEGNKTFLGTTTVATPLNASDAATKAYVDELKIMILDLQAQVGVTDSRDGIHYNAVRIGTQVWMSENLKYLPSVVGPATSSYTIPYYYVNGYYGTDVNAAKATAKYSIYGVLYNWAAVMNGAASSSNNPSGVKGVCPNGWHLPSNAEWLQLTDYLGGANIAGGKLKETGTSHWTAPNLGATNEANFNAIPVGYSGSGDNFYPLNGEFCELWSSTESNSHIAYDRYITYNSAEVKEGPRSKNLGLSVRCVKD